MKASLVILSALLTLSACTEAPARVYRRARDVYPTCKPGQLGRGYEEVEDDTGDIVRFPKHGDHNPCVKRMNP
jgi:hypothetical protein